MRAIRLILTCLCAGLALLTTGVHALSGLRVYCDQEGAEVFLNGGRAGVCPFIDTVKAGSYRLEVRKNLSDQSYYYYSSQINLQDKDMSKVEATLVRIYPEEYWYSKAAQTKYISDWDEYLRRYPNGGHSNEAHQILENYFYTQASNSGSQSNWQEYLRRYPNGYRTDVARREIARIQQAEAAQAALAEQARRDAIERAKQERAEAIRQGKLLIDCDICPEMVVVPAGSFQMGRDGNEEPVHSVRIKSFAMGRTEVTQGQWKAVMGSNPSNFSSCGDNCPVEWVSWDDVQQYIEKLNAKSGKRYRLPSESEWEYACRAGGQHQYCGSDNLDAVAWHETNSGKTTHPVATRQANAFGLFDMSGNVWEWVQDCWHDNYKGAPTDGSAWSAWWSCEVRVLRGGSWIVRPAYLRSAIRYRSTPGSRDVNFGFRLVRTLVTP